MTASYSSSESGSGLLGRRRASTTAAAAPPGRVLVPWMFGISLLVAILLFAFRPIASGHSYQLGVRVTAVLGSIWYVATYRSYWLAKREFLGLAFVAGLYFCVQRPLTIRANSEIIAAYGSAFAALDAGQNPYTSGTIVHHDEHGQNKLGNFNYPPVELWPYYAISKLVGRWDHQVLTVTLLALQLAACGLLYLTFRRPETGEQNNAVESRGPPSAARVALAFAPLLTCFELHTNVALTLFAVAFAIYLLCGRKSAEAGLRSWLLWAWFGVALLTKFLVIPLFATYVLHVVSFRSWRAFGVSLRGPCLSLGLCALLMLPFGITHVLRETLLFNLVLSQRATLTTFYPNVLSGLSSWLGIPGAFPVLAVLLLGGAVLYARRFPLLQAMFVTGSVFLLASPTPEPQYIPVMLYLALCAHLQGEREAFACLSAGPRDGEAEGRAAARGAG